MLQHPVHENVTTAISALTTLATLVDAQQCQPVYLLYQGPADHPLGN